MTKIRDQLTATILVVDRAALREPTLAALLGSRGHLVLSAPDGESALAMLHHQKPDLVITDILLPDMDAREFITRLRAAHAPGQLPRVIFRHAPYLESEARALGLECGVMHVVSKGARFEALDAVVTSALTAEIAGLASPGAGAGGALGSLTSRLLHRVTDLELSVARQRERSSGLEARLEAARAALLQEITKRIWAERELTEANRRLRDQAVRDALTGLHNRRYLEESLDREESRARRNRIALGVMMIDIDHFKRCNDTYGHAAGDTVLRGVAQYLHSLTRGEDILCRYGGEEFVLVMASNDEEAIHDRAEALRNGVQQMSLDFDGRRLPVTISIGVALLPEHGDNAWAVLRAADSALYQAKQSGRNRVVLGQRRPH